MNEKSSLNTKYIDFVMCGYNGLVTIQAKKQYDY